MTGSDDSCRPQAMPGGLALSALLHHELAPVRMLVAEAAAGREGGPALLAAAMRHLDLVCEHLPGLVSAASDADGAHTATETLVEAVRAAGMFCGAPPELSSPSAVGSLPVPAPSLRVALRNVFVNAEAYAGGVREVSAMSDGSTVTVTVTEEASPSPSPSVGGFGVGVSLAELVMAGCGGRILRETSFGRFSGVTVLSFPLVDSRVSGLLEEGEQPGEVGLA